MLTPGKDFKTTSLSKDELTQLLNLLDKWINDPQTPWDMNGPGWAAVVEAKRQVEITLSYDYGHDKI